MSITNQNKSLIERIWSAASTTRLYYEIWERTEKGVEPNYYGCVKVLATHDCFMARRTALNLAQSQLPPEYKYKPVLSTQKEYERCSLL